VSTPERWPDVFDEVERAVLGLADAMAGDSSAIAAGLAADLRRHFGEADLAELILVAGQASFNNRVGNAAKQLLGDHRTA